jgi:hypothetical protein
MTKKNFESRSELKRELTWHMMADGKINEALISLFRDLFLLK